MRISNAFLPLAAAAILITGCGNEKPATDAVAQASAAVEKIRPDASQYAPEELKATDAVLTRMKQNLAAKKYSEVVKDIPQINTEYKTAVDASVSMKTLAAAAENEWTELNEEVPKTVQELDTRVETLSAGKLPKEITKETLAAAKTDLDKMKATWAEATAAASAGDKLKATDRGRSAKLTGDKLKEQLSPESTVAAR
jgi:DNA repair ATPase RecN